MFHFGTNSQHKLSTIHHILARVAHGALAISSIDFGVISGLRTGIDQLELYKRKDSQLNGIQKGKKRGNMIGTGVSMHQFRLAFDVLAYIGPTESWEVSLYVEIADAIRVSATSLGVKIIWGGCWDKPLTDMKSAEDIRKNMKRYQRKKAAQGKTAFVDAGHFQLERRL